ncbi:hypothetical protein P171DRAFT_261195 [Karstenula rhodostoma CBS 690.94]|uniref:Uncharacterized protein n=1 Tax=Karstenula rhodostoma CBS 690.94 TaxID=1392251 RepID=A0A9P4UDM8_9PLEO|nr:hypothetical protein P171DRAFT_261195 [Karstenula rhodostoma CBS 690.94]
MPPRKSQEHKILQKKLGYNAHLLQHIPRSLELEPYEGDLRLPGYHTALSNEMLRVGTEVTDEDQVKVYALPVKNDKVRKTIYRTLHMDSGTWSSFVIRDRWSSLVLRDELKDANLTEDQFAAVVKMVFTEKGTVDQHEVPFSDAFIRDLVRACQQLQHATELAARPPTPGASSASAEKPLGTRGKKRGAPAAEKDTELLADWRRVRAKVDTEKLTLSEKIQHREQLNLDIEEQRTKLDSAEAELVDVEDRMRKGEADGPRKH